MNMVENAIEVMRPIVELAGLILMFVLAVTAIGFVCYHVWYEVYGNWLYKYIDPAIERIKEKLKH